MAKPTRERRLAYLRKAFEELQADSEDPRHGTNTGYSYGCRCERCRQGRSEYMARLRGERKERKERLVIKKDDSQLLRHLKSSAHVRKVNIHGVGEVEI